MKILGTQKKCSKSLECWDYCWQGCVPIFLRSEMKIFGTQKMCAKSLECWANRSNGRGQPAACWGGARAGMHLPQHAPPIYTIKKRRKKPSGFGTHFFTDLCSIFLELLYYNLLLKKKKKKNLRFWHTLFDEFV